MMWEGVTWQAGNRHGWVSQGWLGKEGGSRNSVARQARQGTDVEVWIVVAGKVERNPRWFTDGEKIPVSM